MLTYRCFLSVLLVFLLGVFIFGSVVAQEPERPAWDSSFSVYAGVGIGYRAGVRFFRDVSADLRGGDPAPSFSVKAGTFLPVGLQLTDAGYLVGTPTGVGESRFTIVAQNTLGVVEKQVALRLREPFNSTYAQGDTHSDILDVQVFLNSTDCPVAQTGAGSPGQETAYFGAKTQQALACYQRLHTLPVSGTLTPILFRHFIQTYTDRFVSDNFTLPPGTVSFSPPLWNDDRITYTIFSNTPVTRNLSRSLLRGYPLPTFSVQAGTTLPPGLSLSPSGIISGTPATTSTTSTTIVATNLYGSASLSAVWSVQGGAHVFGSTHPDIRQAQVYLNGTPCPVAQTGPGSPGQETAYFGTKTQQALACYQRLHALPVTNAITPMLLARLAGVSSEEHGVCDLTVSRGCTVGTPIQYDSSYISRGERWRCRGVNQGYSSDWCVRCDEGYSFDGTNCIRGVQGSSGLRCSDTTRSHCRLPRSAAGSTVTGTCSASRTGFCQYACSDGVWTAVKNTCAKPLPCAGGTVVDCVLQDTRHDTLVNGSCTTGSTGACRYRCTNGTWQLVSSTCSQSDTPRGHLPGSSHADVRQAQVYLNGTPCPVAQTGAGSPGQETAYFGAKTQQALACYQRLHALPVTNIITSTLLTHLSEHYIPPALNAPNRPQNTPVLQPPPPDPPPAPQPLPPDSPPVAPVVPQDGVCDLTASRGCTVGTPIQYDSSYISRGERWRCRGVNQGYSSDWCVRCDDGYSFNGRNCARSTAQRSLSLPCSGTTLSYCRLPRSAAGSTVTGTCSTGQTGTCRYTCSNGTWQLVSNTCSFVRSDQPNDPGSVGEPDNRVVQPRTVQLPPVQPPRRVRQSSQQTAGRFGYAVGVGGNVPLRPCKIKRCCDSFCAADSGCRWCVECDEICTDCDWDKLRCRKRVQTAIVGSYDAGAGSAYFYVRHEDVPERKGEPGEIEWRLQERVVADDGKAGDAFGYAVAMDEDVAVVGAPGDDTNTGSAYIFMRVFEDERVQWIQQEKLVSDDRDTADRFGSAVAIDGATIVVGASGENPEGTQNAGAVYVFVRSGDRWDLQERLIADDPGEADKFGHSVAVSGNTISVGAYHDDPRYDHHAGSVYTFTRSNRNWEQQEKILADDRQPNDQFGSSVALIGENCAGGNCCIPVDGRWSTVPMPYELPCGKVVKATCTAPAPSCGGSPCVGPPPTSLGTVCGVGRCDIVVRACKPIPCCGPLCTPCVSRAARWESPSCQDAPEIRCAAKIPNTDGICIMGQTCDCRGIYCYSERPVRKCFGDGTNCPSGSRMIVSANQNNTFAGSVYVFSDGKQKRVTASDADAYDRFGTSIDISEDTLIVGAENRDPDGVGGAGSVYMFDTLGVQQDIITAEDKQRHDHFGGAASVYDMLMIIGAYRKNSYAGSVYIFSRIDGEWEEEVQLKE